MKKKNYILKLSIDCESVTVFTPGGRYFMYSKNSLPELIHRIAEQCLKDDEELCRSTREQLKSE